MLTKDTKLRFWCQKVLPLVYDDSLSYYELLNKVVLHLNQHTEDINQLIDFYDTFSEEVEEVIQQMIEDGDFSEIVADTLGGIIAEEYDPTKSYIIFDYCIFQGKLYRANGSTTGVFDPEKWDEKTVGYDLTTIQNYIYSLNAGNVAYDETETYDDNTVGKTLKNLNTASNGKLDSTATLINSLSDLTTTSLIFRNTSSIAIGSTGIAIPAYSRGIFLNYNSTDGVLIAVTMDEDLIFAQREGGTWTHATSVKAIKTGLSTEITNRSNADTAIENIIATKITTLVAPRALSIGDYVIYNDVLYRVITSIPNGSAITIGTNVVATTIKNIKTYTGSGTDSNGSTATINVTLYDDSFAVVFIAVTSGINVPVGADIYNGSITFTPNASFGQTALVGYAAERVLIGTLLPNNTLVIRNTIREFPSGVSAALQGVAPFIN